MKQNDAMFNDSHSMIKEECETEKSKNEEFFELQLKHKKRQEK